MVDGLEQVGGLFVPKQKKEPRKYAALRAVPLRDGTLLLAISQDGAGFVKLHDAASTDWTPLPELPPLG